MKIFCRQTSECENIHQIFHAVHIITLMLIHSGLGPVLLPLYNLKPNVLLLSSLIITIVITIGIIIVFIIIYS